MALRVAVDGVIEVDEELRVTEEEDRGVIPHDVPVALLGVEAYGEASDVSLGIGSAPLTGYGGEAGDHPALVADLAEDLSLGVLRDVVGDAEGPPGAPALGVHTPLGDYLTIEVRMLLEEPVILHRERTPRTGALRVIVIGYRYASCAGHPPGMDGGVAA